MRTNTEPEDKQEDILPLRRCAKQPIRYASFLLLFWISCTCGLAQQSYFPKGTIDHFWARCFAVELTKLHEPSLLRRWTTSAAESYRFLWLRTFDPPIAVRLEVLPGGTGRLTVKMANGEAGYPSSSTRITLHTTRLLSKEQVQPFLTLVQRTGFWSIPSQINDDQQGSDGSEWIVEAEKAGKYHVAHRWSPSSSTLASKEAVRKIGLSLAIDLAQLQIPKNRMY